MTKVTPGSAVFLDQQFPVDPEDFDFDDQRIIVIKSDPMVLPIKNIVDKFNLRLFDAEKISTHGGSLRYYICKNDSKHKNTKRLTKILNSETFKKESWRR